MTSPAPLEFIAMKRLFAFLFLLCSSVVSAAESPRDIVVQASQQMLAAIKAEENLLKQNPQYIYDLVGKILLPHFDFTTMSRWVLGKHWRTLSADEQQRFTNEFRTLLVRSYAVSLMEYRDVPVNYLPLTVEPGVEDVTVRTEVRLANNPRTIPMNYRMRMREGAWKVYDVTIDGVSLVANYRSSFSTEISKGGAQQLIQTLIERNRKSGT
jgi:phospholipid transport system substrate-binding protein